MVRKLLMLVSVGILLTPTIFHAAQAQDRGGEGEPLYLSIPAPGPDGGTFLGLVGARTFEIPNPGPDGRTLLLRASGKTDAMAILGSRDGQVSEVIPATRPLREIAFPLLPEPESACVPSSGPREVRLQLFNPGSLEARVEARGLASDGRELEVVSLPPLLPQEHRTIDVAEVFRSASATFPASVRLSSDQPLVGLQWRSTESDLAALPGLQTAREWQVPSAKLLTGSVTASLWLFNPGADNTVLSVEDASHGTAVSVSLRPGELREVAATGWIHAGIRVLSGNPVAAYMLYRSATGCGWATASAGPGLTRAMQPIEIEASADGSRLVAWPSAAVTDETLSFRHPVDQVSVLPACGLGGICAGGDFDRHPAVDYGTANTNPPAFASNFGTLRRTIDFNQGTGCNTAPLSCNMGNSVVIEYLQTNGEKWLSQDSHLAAKTVAGSGSRIAKGQQIGVVGCSGETLCSWCTNSTSSCTAYGNGTSYNMHAHHEHKLPDLGTPNYFDLWPYGYMNSSEANQLKRPNETSISIAEALSRGFTTVDALNSRGIRVLVPFFSPFTSSPGPGNYEVYGIAGTPLNATLTVTPTTARTFTNIRVGGRVWNNDNVNMDLFTIPSTSIGANETRTLSGARTFALGDYNFYAYIEHNQDQDLNKILGRGYSIKLAVLPNASSIVIDNDGRSGYVASEAGAQTVPGYYLSASLFQGGSGNWAQWRPGRAGLFEIWVHVPAGATASQILYKIYTDGTNSTLSSPVSQASANDQWVKLISGSTQSWTLSSTGYVGLSVENIPGTEKAGADAIKFIYLGAGNSVPAAPSNLSATTDSTFRAILLWNDNSSNETGFKIERKLGASGSWSQIATLSAGSTGYADTGLSPSTTYVYRVRATNGSGDSAYSNEASITTVAGSCSSSTSTITSGQTLAGNLSSTDCYSSVRTSSYYDRFPFIATAGVSYTITMTSSLFDTYLVLKNASGTMVANNDDADGTNSRITYTVTTAGTYVIEATSYGSRATGAYTVSLSGSGGNSAPAAPSNLSATTDSTFRAVLLWNDNSSNETGFKIERKLGPSGSWSQIATLGAGSTGYADTGLSPSTTYVYRVRATNGSGDSAYSNEASITTIAGGGCSSSSSTITSGQTLAGNLSSTDCYSSVRTSSYYDRFPFIATAGVSYTITMTSSLFDTYLVLENASGAVLATNDDADGSNSRITYTLTTAGTYVIEATSYTSRATGAYTVSLSGSGGNSAPAAPSNLSATTDSTFRAILFWNDNSSNETGFKIERKLGASGSWSQIATLSAGSTGYADTGLSPSTTYVYRVRATNGSGDSAYSNEASITTIAGGGCSSSSSTITSGQTLAGNLSSTDCYSSVRTSSYYDRFPFIATAGVSYTINMTSSLFDTYLVLKNASGAVLATNDDASGTDSRIIYTPTTSGTYVIEATSYTSRATGSYSVSLSGH